MRKDEGHEETDRLLSELEKKIARKYAQASREVQEKLDDYLRRFEIKDEKWQIMVANGTKSAAEYKKWRVGQIMVGQKWEALRDQLARDYHNSNMVARSMVQGYMPEVYAINHNFATYQIEKEANVDTSFTLYDRQTVERIIRDEPDLLPPPGPRMKASLAEKKDIAWQKGQIQSVTLQSILQGESIPNMSKRIARTMGETNHKSTIRYARTAATGAQNAGRQDAYKRAEKMGIDMEREWVATLDNRTRHEHRQLDGQVRGVDEPFEVDGLEIMYPGDPTAEGHLIWNCRCTTVAKVKGWEDISGQTRSSEAIGGMSYEEWKEGHSQPRRITAQEEAGEAARQGYIAEYRNAGKADSENGEQKETPEGLEALSRLYINHSDKLYKYLQNVEPIEGFEDFAVHGVPGKPLVVIETNIGIETEYTAREFADIVKADPEYHGGKVRLLSCEAGSDTIGFAKELARALGQEVMAPTETLWVAENGELFITNNDTLAELWYNGGDIDHTIRQTGRMKVFSPKRRRKNT